MIEILKMNTMTIDGKRYVAISENDYRRMASAVLKEHGLIAKPDVDENGNVPAIEAGRVSIANQVIVWRRAAGLSQTQLAKASGVRQETISRIESATVSPLPTTIQRLVAILEKHITWEQAKTDADEKGWGLFL